MRREQARGIIYSVFSDMVMVILALLVIPIVLFDFVKLPQAARTIVDAVDAVIYFAFLFEFVLKVLVEKDKTLYIRKNRLDSIISVIIIISPAFDLVSSYFVGVPVLRLLRVSRLIRLAGVSGKAEEKWRNVNLKSYAIAIIIIAFGIVASILKPAVQYSQNDIIWVSTSFIPVIGILYALIATFMIVNSWNAFNALSDYLRKEAISLKTLYLLSMELGQKKIAATLRKNISDYANCVVNTYWNKKSTVQEAEENFIRLFQFVRDVAPSKQKEQSLVADMNDELRAASVYRVSALSLITSKTPAILWVLLIMLSTFVIFSFLMINFDNHIVATLIIGMVSSAVALVTTIIYDMGYPFQAGFWVISPDVYMDLEKAVQGKVV